MKIDQSFIRSIGSERGGVEIVRAVIGLGRALGIKVLVEGVETAEQLSLLKAEGCDELQGYLFGRPQPLCNAWDNINSSQLVSSGLQGVNSEALIRFRGDQVETMAGG